MQRALTCKDLIAWYARPWKHYTQFRGRANRAEFSVFIGFNSIVLAIWGLLTWIGSNHLIHQPKPNHHVSIILLVAWSLIYPCLILAMIPPYLAVTARRLHDIGYSGWHCIVVLIPVIGVIIALTLAPIQGETGANQFGPDPNSPWVHQTMAVRTDHGRVNTDQWHENQRY